MKENIILLPYLAKSFSVIPPGTRSEFLYRQGTNWTESKRDLYLFQG